MDRVTQYLDAILEDHATIAEHSPLDQALRMSQQMVSHTKSADSLKAKLTVAKDRICGDLALTMRQINPSLTISLDNSGCKIGYKTKHLHFTPEFEDGVWRVTSPNARFQALFRRDYAPHTSLRADVSFLARAVNKFFIDYYKSLNEELDGTGDIVIDNRPATMLDIAEWRKKNTLFTLNTRAARQRYG